MNTVKLVLPHIGKLIPFGFSILWPPNGMVVARNFLSLLRGQPWVEYIQRRSNLGLTSDVRACKSQVFIRVLIERSLGWLTYSQDKVGSGGVGCYEFYRWTRGYPEVTGYLIPTFWDCYKVFQRQDLADRAIRMADWEISIQKPDGGFEGHYEGDGQPPVVFNTGQVIRGLARTFEETRDQRFLDTAIRAANWIVSSQEADGSWALNNYKGMKRVYDSYVAAPLSRLAKITGEERFANAAARNCEFVLQHQRENGWFELCDNTLFNNAAPVTHTICYTADGLIETGEILGRSEFIKAGQKTADKLMHLAEISPRFWGRFDKDWKPRAKFVCLTGCAQLGVILMKLHGRSKDPRYLNTSLKLLDFLAYTQRLNSWGRARYGAMAGSYPIWGMYCPLKYPSWANKYFIDMLLLIEEAIK